MNKKDFKKFIIPDSPGVYFFLKGKEIIYIGKATSLRDRVKSYFSNNLIENRGPVLVDMLFQASNIKTQKTDSVLEALILEADLIKKYQPKYNTKEKSDKSFNYVCITKEEIPKVITLRGRELEKNEENFCTRGFQPVLGEGRRAKNLLYSSLDIFGPFTNGSQLKEALRIVRKIFPYIDESSSKKQNYEFYKQLKLTPASLKEYKKNIRNIKLFFEGKKKQILKNLKKEMKFHIKKLEFEKAGEIKRQIFALNHINDVALIKEAKEFSLLRLEAYDIAHMSGRNMVGVMVIVENGEINKSEYKRFKIKTQINSNDTGALAEILERRLAHPEWQYPSLIVVDGGKAQINTVRKILLKYGIEIPIVSVVKNEYHKPKEIMGDKEYIKKYESEILLANNEAHRFAIAYHKNMRAKKFLK